MTVFGTNGVKLPTQAELESSHLYHRLGVEKLFGQAFYLLIAKYAHEVCFSDPSRPAVFAVDETWRVTLSEEGAAIVLEFIRDGRKVKAIILLGSHDPDVDFGGETLSRADRHQDRDATPQPPARGEVGGLARLRPRRPGRPDREGAEPLAPGQERCRAARPPRGVDRRRPDVPVRRPASPAAGPHEASRGHLLHTTQPGRRMSRRPPRPSRALQARVQSWAQSSTDFPMRRSVVWAVTLIVLVMVGGATTLAAHADPAGGGGLLSAIDVADSKGIRVSQYELSIGAGSVFEPARLWLSLRLMTAWELYRYGVGLVAYVFDWTLSMTWLNAIITPLDAAARQIRDQLISPIGLASVMLLISAVVGGIRIVYGKTGQGIWDILSAAAVAAAVAALLVSPVAAVTGGH